MTRSARYLLALLIAVIGLTGCHPQQPLYFNEDGDLSHYLDVATNIEYPDTCTKSLDEVTGARAPLTLENDKPESFWDLSLEHAVQATLANSKVMRTLGGRFLSSAFNPRPQVGEAPDAILTAPDRIPTIYDAAITESTPFIGVESALAAFDAQFTSNLLWEKNDRPQNVRATGLFGGFFVPVFEQDNSTFNAQISKTNATGGTVAVRNNVFYDANNNPTRQVFSDWNVNWEASFAQPLLQGSGAQFNRIAGPQNPFTGVGTPGFDGVMLARINTDISLADFEAGVRNLVNDTENAYWELYFSYRALEASRTGRDSALQTWKRIHALYVVGARGGEAEKEAQAREQYFLFRGQVQTSLNDLYRAENRLRYIMGLAVADGRLIRPCDEPTTARVAFDWCEVHAESLARSVELRRQKWRIKQRELELIAARSLLQPRLDAIGRYRWLGLGDDLIQQDRQPQTSGLVDTNAYQSLTSGAFQEWQLGLQANIPIGFRRELSQIRHYQLQLARERARLEDQELEVSHELADAVRNLEYNYDLTVTNFNRRVAAEKQVEAVEAAFKAETVTLDLLLDAQRRRADAEIAFYRTLADYNRGIMLVHYRKGSLLEYNGVCLAEGPWPAKAQFDAHRRARQRDASYYMDYGYTRPRVISQGALPQHMGTTSPEAAMRFEGAPQEAQPEEVPAPTPARPAGREATRREPPALTRSAEQVATRKLATQTKAAPAAYDWGQLGLAKKAQAVSPLKAKPQTQGPAAGGSSAPRLLPPQAAARPAILGGQTKPSMTAASPDWTSRPTHESLAHQATGTADRPLAGWKGSERR